MWIRRRYCQIKRMLFRDRQVISQSLRTNSVVIELSTIIDAPIQVCFDLSRSIDLHIESTKHTGEKAIAGRTSGLIEPGETVTWRAKHFGVWQNLTSKITEFQSPDYFTDEMVSGAFKSFRHEHLFFALNNQTVMKDIFTFESPLGWLGRLVNILVLGRYMERLLTERNRVIKIAAETARKF
jgi:ligand-binding SRPBCC domain-containing protein